MKKISLFQALIPILLLVLLLFFNVFFVFGDEALDGSNQFILLIGGAIAALIGFYNGVPYKTMISEISENVKSTTSALVILLMVGALSGTWMASGIIPTIVYYGLQILNPSFFLVASLISCAIVSISTGSSWTTTATVGIALILIGGALNIPNGMTAGAVLSGAYFGDKLSPLSDTTNLAPAMAGADLFTHIRYMTITTIPTFAITFLIFLILGLNLNIEGSSNISNKLNAISDVFNISPWLLIVPTLVIFMIFKKTPPLTALFTGVILASILIIIAQPQIIFLITNEESITFTNSYEAIMKSITGEVKINTRSTDLNKLFSSDGMKGMMGTIWLILCAMVFGGVMSAIGALSKITKAILKTTSTIFGLFASTVCSCLALNLTASDQYLALVVPGKMYQQAFEDNKLAPENLSRTLEDSGTVTSVLVPWNTCGAYQSGTLGVSVGEYFVYAFFNWISPFMTLLIAALSIKIKRLKINN